MKPSKYSRLSLEERRRHLREYANLTDEELSQIDPSGGLSLESADHMIENVVGVISVPMAVVPGLTVNGKDYYVPLVTEQKRTITMAKIGLELAQEAGGFTVESTRQIMIGQIQLVEIPDYDAAYVRVMDGKAELLKLANTQSRSRKSVDLQMRRFNTAVGPMAVVELLVDVRDSMGANVVDSMVETIAPTIQELTGGSVKLRILSNLATKRTVTVKVKVSPESIDEKTASDIVEAYAFAHADPYRAATHNKGIMNGVASVLLATSNDTRAVEAGAHAYAAVTGRYVPLSKWSIDEEGGLEGELTMPMALGIIGGSIATHPTSKLALKILGVESAAELGMITASIGLACNLGALYTLVTEGITSIS
jgi:hydroxymethylglutaryl-CoA reductase